MADLIIKKGQSTNLNEENVPIIDGQILITEDTGEMFVDMSDGTRKKIGETPKTPEGGNVFGDIENNKAYNINTMGLGVNTIAGSNAFKIISVDTENSIMELSSVNGLEVGFICSCQYSNNYDFFGIIIEILENNKIKFDVLPNGTFKDGQTNVLWIPEHPELGDGETFIGEGAFASGEGTKAIQQASNSLGRDNISAGKYSLTAGRDNVATYQSVALGRSNKAYGQTSMILGHNNTTYDAFGNLNGHFIAGFGNNQPSIEDIKSWIKLDCLGIKWQENKFQFACGYKDFILGNNNLTGGTLSFAIGEENFVAGTNTIAIGKNLISATKGQIVLGRYNQDSESLFVIGNGNNEDSRNNIFEINNNEMLYKGSKVLNEAEISSLIENEIIEKAPAIIVENVPVLKGTGTNATLINGNNSKATGKQSTSGGSSTAALNNNTVAFGNKAIAKGAHSFAFGFSGMAYDQLEGTEYPTMWNNASNSNKFLMAYGSQSFAAGNNTFAEGSVAAAFGQRTYAKGHYSFTTGTDTRAEGMNSFVAGKNTIASADNQFVAGINNKTEAEALFIVGNGTTTSEAGRKNAFVVKKDGSAEVQVQGKTDNSVVIKNYVDGIETPFNADFKYTNTDPIKVAYNYTKIGKKIEFNATAYIDFDTIDSDGEEIQLQLPENTKTNGLCLGNILISCTEGTGYWYQFTGIPKIKNNKVYIILNGVCDSYHGICLAPYKIQELLKSIGKEEEYSTIKELKIDYVISYTAE